MTAPSSIIQEDLRSAMGTHGSDANNTDYEMASLPGTHGQENPSAALSTQSSQAALRHAGPQSGTTVQELPPVDRGVKAWTFCVAGVVLEMMVWGFSYSYGIFQDYYTSHPPFDKSSGISIAAIGTVALSIQYGEVIFLSLFFGRYPDFLRTGMWLGLALYFASLFFSSFATEVWQLILLQGVGVGVGGGLLYMPVIKLLPEWFSERRGLAGGIIQAGNGVGGFVFPFVLNALLDKVGLRWTLRILAVGTTLCSVIAMFGIRSRFPVPKYTAHQRRPRFIPPQVTFLKNPLFWTFAITNLVQGLAHFPVSLYIASFTRSISTQLTATIVLALFNASAVLGQIVLGHLSDRFPYPSIMAVSALGSALVTFFLWGFANTALFLYFFAVIFGGLSGGYTSTWPNAAVESVGGQLEYAGMAFSGTAFFRGISAVVGPVIAGVLLQTGRGETMAGGFGRFGYGAVELFVGSCALVTGLGSIAVAFARRRVLS